MKKKKTDDFHVGFTAGILAMAGVVLLFTGIIGFQRVDEQNEAIRHVLGTNGYVGAGIFALILALILIQIRDHS